MLKKGSAIGIMALVIIVLAIVLFFYLYWPQLSKNSGANTTGTEGSAAGGGASQGGGTPSGTDIPTAIASGVPVECNITITGNVGTATINAKIKSPKRRVVVSGNQGQQSVLVTPNGNDLYFGSTPDSVSGWVKMTSSQMTESGAKFSLSSNEELIQQFKNPPAGMTVNCRVVNDIPDSEFSPPAGADVKSYDEVYGNA